MRTRRPLTASTTGLGGATAAALNRLWRQQRRSPAARGSGSRRASSARPHLARAPWPSGTEGGASLVLAVTCIPVLLGLPPGPPLWPASVDIMQLYMHLCTLFATTRVWKICPNAWKFTLLLFPFCMMHRPLEAAMPCRRHGRCFL